MTNACSQPLRYALRTLLATCALLAALIAAAPDAYAGTLHNRDAEAYDYTCHWDDLEAPASGVIQPGEVVVFRESPCTLALPKRKDSISMRPGDAIGSRAGATACSACPSPRSRRRGLRRRMPSGRSGGPGEWRHPARGSGRFSGEPLYPGAAEAQGFHLHASRRRHRLPSGRHGVLRMPKPEE